MGNNRAIGGTKAGRRVTPKSSKLSPLLAAKSVVRRMKSAKVLTHKERDLVASALVGDVPPSHPMMESPLVQEAIIEALGELQIDDKYVASKIKEGLEAMETKFATHEGVITDERDVINWAARHKYLTTLLDVARVTGKSGESAGPRAVHFHYRSNLRKDSKTINVIAPTNEKARRRLIAAKPTNRREA